MNSTLGSIVPLAMFKNNNRVANIQQVLFLWERRSLSPGNAGHTLTSPFSLFVNSKVYNFSFGELKAYNIYSGNQKWTISHLEAQRCTLSSWKVPNVLLTLTYDILQILLPDIEAIFTLTISEISLSERSMVSRYLLAGVIGWNRIVASIVLGMQALSIHDKPLRGGQHLKGDTKWSSSKISKGSLHKKVDAIESEKLTPEGQKSWHQKVTKGYARKSEKIDTKKSEKVDSRKSEKVDSSKSEKVDTRKSEKVVTRKPKKVDTRKSEKVDTRKQEGVDSRKPEKVDSRKPEKVDTRKSEKSWHQKVRKR